MDSAVALEFGEIERDDIVDEHGNPGVKAAHCAQHAARQVGMANVEIGKPRGQLAPQHGAQQEWRNPPDGVFSGPTPTLALLCLRVLPACRTTQQRNHPLHAQLIQQDV
ncbi:MAG: hypothetical protein AAFY03_14085, partial [Pseudomonadota bacterium]